MYTVAYSDSVYTLKTRPAMAFLLVQAPENPLQDPALSEKKQQIAAQLQGRYPQKEAILQDPVIAAYQRYYQQFKSNYHVRFQIESVALKGKALPQRSVLVDAMFMAELQFGVLIAGHDAGRVTFPLQVDCTNEGELYTLLSGDVKAVHDGDLCIRDREKILSTILYGPEESSPITPQTNRALYTIYGPDIDPDTLSAALDEIQVNIKLALPQMEVLWREVTENR